jgi:hypothetical protein
MIQFSTKSFFTCFGLIFSNVFGSVAFAQTMALVKTEGGCDLYTDVSTRESLKKIPNAEFKITWQWDGECIGGLAQGLGNHKMDVGLGPPNGDSTHTTRQYYHAGYPVGYGKFSIDSKIFSMQGWVFNYRNTKVFFNGLGLAGNDALVNDITVILPQENLSDFQKGQIFETASHSATFEGAHCGLYKTRFPECGFDTGESTYDVYYVRESPKTGNNYADYKASTNTYCPDPRNPQSCTALVQQKTAAYRTEIVNFIQQAKPEVEATFKRMNEVLAAAGKLASNTDSNTAAKANPKTAGQSSPTHSPEFLQSINTMSVGQLFSLADDYQGKGDHATTRIVLRKLIERFPDHALASLAAKQLTNVQTP